MASKGLLSGDLGFFVGHVVKKLTTLTLLFQMTSVFFNTSVYASSHCLQECIGPFIAKKH